MKRLRFLLFLAAALCLAPVARAEWRSESYQLRPGWNAIYPSVDASHLTLDALLQNSPDVLEVWRWQPERVDPRMPGNIAVPPTGLEWSTWKRDNPDETSFNALQANFGYLVRLADTAAVQTLTVRGRATLPEIRWRGDGLHLAGFPVLGSGNPPTFSSYLAPTGFALGGAQIYGYNGGPIVNGANPLLLNPSTSRPVRGKAYWVRVNSFSRYYGPLKVELDSGTRVDFGTQSVSVKLLLTNQTTGAISVTLDTVASEAAPAGQPAVAGAVPLRVRVDAETDYTPLTSRVLTLPAGAIMPVRVAVDRSALGGAVGAHFASLLRLVTTAGLAGQETYVPVTADVGSIAGLWIGEAQITGVASVVRRYERDASGNTVYDPVIYDSNGQMIGGGGPRIVEDLTTPGAATTLPGVKKPYPLRLIVHVDASRQARLLSHVFQGKRNGSDEVVLTTSQSILDSAALASATRLSVAHLPLDTDAGLSGTFAAGASLLTPAALVTPYTSATNPFVHAYHPDHDNLDARFSGTVLPAGVESFDIRRTVTIAFDALPPDGAPEGWGVSSITGTYAELIEGPYKSPLRVRGSFSLYKVSAIPALTR